jgi:23S rRNA pseudouridine1911/1915/1917 synthase
MQFVVTAEEAGQRLDHLLSGRLKDYSRARIQSWIEAGRVEINGTPVRKPSQKLKAGDSVEATPAELKPLRAFAEEIPLEILYEDGDVVAINKPAGLVVHAGAGQSSGTLVNALLHHFTGLSQVGGDLRPGIVHRLDKGTSGVLLVAKTDKAHQHLAAQFADRSVEKIYLALVHGQPPPEEGQIRLAIARDPVRRTRMTARLGAGRAAFTGWRVLERLPGHALLEVRIGTGRTHQIRVHLSAIGYPIVGDPLYGAPRQAALPRPWLHAWRISFLSPSREERITVQAPLAPELEAWKNRLLE